MTENLPFRSQRVKIYMNTLNPSTLKKLQWKTIYPLKYLTNIYDKCIDNQTFPLSLEKADVIPSHQQLESVKDYRPISLLPCISKLYERDL